MKRDTVFQFNEETNTEKWNIVTDAVMGGKSTGNFNLNKKTNGHFKGHVSLDNNGGFSSVKNRFNKIYVKDNSMILLKIKGDGKTYQFRIKNKSSDRHSKVSHFETSKNWQTITLNLSDMYPTCKGKRLDIPNFDNNSFEEISFFIGNKRDEKFELEIKDIDLQ
jgi:NADH dehydrogenase [ubiquinone] 1 alpha subcomplex assembly factor 1